MARHLDWRRLIPPDVIMPACSRSVQARNGDVEMMAVRARRGEVPWEAVVPLAIIWAASRKAQAIIGPGHLPLEAILDFFPEQYVSSCLARRQARLREVAA